MNRTEEAYIVEQGNGLPDIGDLVVFDMNVYEVVDYTGPILTNRTEGNYSMATVRRMPGDIFDYEDTAQALMWSVRYAVNTYDEDGMPVDDNVDRTHTILGRAGREYRSIRDDYHRLTITREALDSNLNVIMNDVIRDSTMDEVD